MKIVKIFGPEILQADDFIKTVNASGKKLCIVKYLGNYFAAQSRCPHAGAELGTGWCENGKLICPYHRYQYDLATGKGNTGQGDYIEMYPVEVKADGVYVILPERYGLLKKLFRL